MDEAEINEVYEMVKTLADIAETGRVSVECRVSFFHDVMRAMETLMDDSIDLVGEDGEVWATIDHDTAKTIIPVAIQQYVIQAIHNAIEAEDA